MPFQRRTRTVTISEERALTILAQECAKAEKCTGDLLAKCTKWGLPTATAECIVARLVKEKFVDDRRYAPSYVRDKARFSGWGPAKIRHQLLQKGIKEEIVDDALETMDRDEWHQILCRAIANKLHTANQDDPLKRFASVVRFGASRGFAYDEIKRAYADCNKETKQD